MPKARRLKRPDFESDFPGGWIDPDYLPMATKQSLQLELPKRMNHEQRKHFLYLVGESVQICEWHQTDTANSDQVKELALLRDRANALLLALNSLSSDTQTSLMAHSLFLAIGSNPPERLSKVSAGARTAGSESNLMGFWWDTTQDIAAAADYAQDQISPSKTERPKQTSARRLTYYVAANHFSVFGKLPPASKSAWFPAFMDRLGSLTGHKIGPALSGGVVTAMRSEWRFTPRSSVEETPDRAHAFFSYPDGGQ